MVQDQAIDVLIPNLKRSLDALGNVLDELLAGSRSLIPNSSRVEVADCLRNLLVSLLESSLPLGPRHSILPKVMKELTISVIRPIICGIEPLSIRIFRSASKATKTDIRPNLLFMLKDLLDCLRRMKQRSRDIREFMILETAKEITRSWKTCSSSKDGDDQLINKLSRKDSLWYHCSLLHLALEELPKALSNEEDRGVLSVVAVDTLAALPKLLEDQKPADEVAKGMVLAVVEKAWLNGLHVESSSS